MSGPSKSEAREHASLAPPPRYESEAAGEPAAPPVTEAMRKNAEWLDKHGGLLADYGDVWVAICGGGPVSSGETPMEAIEKADAAGHAGQEMLLVYAGEDNLIY